MQISGHAALAQETLSSTKLRYRNKYTFTQVHS